MSAADPAAIAESWIAKWSVPDGPPGDWPSPDLDWEIPRQDPELCLATILEVLSRIRWDSTDLHFQVLAAGPMEDLLRYHGERMLPAIERAIGQRPALGKLLGGVWQSSIHREVWARVLELRDSEW